METIGEIVRRQETVFLDETTHISKYVDVSMHDIIERIGAYLNSRHISGEKDSLSRDKPFFNISVAVANIWFRATDIDRSNIRVRATKSGDFVGSFMATALLQDWMRRERFGYYLNDWGRTLARYGSAVTKFVKNSSGLHISVVPWDKLIVDTVDFDANPKIEVIELTEAQLYSRVKTHGYDKVAVKALCDAETTRKTLDKQNKDNKTGYYRLYEVHGLLEESLLTDDEEDEDYVQQMHVISYVANKKGRNTEYEDFTLYSGREARDPYMISHLIKEDGRTLAIGAVEHLFESQWMVNHSMKAMKDTLDLSSKLIFQTSDTTIGGRNVLTEIETGDILYTQANMNITKVDTSKVDLVGMSNYAVAWKNIGNEIAGISESMLGAQPKSGTAWRQTEAMLSESYSLFELMTENKGLAIEDMLREHILPYLKTKIDTKDEIVSLLGAHNIDKIDALYIRNEGHKRFMRDFAKKLIKGDLPTPEEQQSMQFAAQAGVTQDLNMLGGKRFYKPSELDETTWDDLLEDLEWDVEVDITGEAKNVQESLATLNTALKLVVTPGFEQNEKAQMIVGRILEMTGAMSPVEYNSTKTTPAPPQLTQAPAPEFAPAQTGT